MKLNSSEPILLLDEVSRERVLANYSAALIVCQRIIYKLIISIIRKMITGGGSRSGPKDKRWVNKSEIKKSGVNPSVKHVL